MRGNIRQFRDLLRARDVGAWLLLTAVVLGFIVGCVIVALRDQLLPEQFGRDAGKILRIASEADPGFRDRSFTPVATVYRVLGLAGDPTVAAFAGYLLAVAVILVALLRGGRLTATWFSAALIGAVFVLSAVYLGQYSKDVFVLPIVALLLLAPRRLWWDVVILATMGAYAYWFREYWAIVVAGYVVLRAVSYLQARLRYLLLVSVGGALAAGLAIWVAFGRAPNYYRTRVVDTTWLDVDTQFRPFFTLPQPWGGLLDILITYWLILVPIALPFTAGVAFLIVAVPTAFVRSYPLLALRSSRRWPAAATADGALLRRSLSLLLAFGSVQALFEPDYGSVLRHVTPVLIVSIAIVQLSRSHAPREGDPRPWSWSGAAAERPVTAPQR